MTTTLASSSRLRSRSADGPGSVCPSDGVAMMVRQRTASAHRTAQYPCRSTYAFMLILRRSIGSGCSEENHKRVLVPSVFESNAHETSQTAHSANNFRGVEGFGQFCAIGAQ